MDERDVVVEGVVEVEMGRTEVVATKSLYPNKVSGKNLSDICMEMTTTDKVKEKQRKNLILSILSPRLI